MNDTTDYRLVTGASDLDEASGLHKLPVLNDEEELVNVNEFLYHWH